MIYELKNLPCSISCWASKEDNIFRIIVKGPLGREDTTLIRSKLLEHLQTHNSINLHIQLLSLEGMSINAAWEDIKKRLPNTVNLEKVAFIADDAWGNYTEVGDFLSPDFDIRHFSFCDKRKAEQWLKSHAA